MGVFEGLRVSLWYSVYDNCFCSLFVGVVFGFGVFGYMYLGSRLIVILLWCCAVICLEGLLLYCV